MRSLLGILLGGLLLVGCGSPNEEQIQQAFRRFAENFALRLQKQFYDSTTAPADLAVKIAPRPEYVWTQPAAPGQPYRGQLKLRQTEIGPDGEQDRLVLCEFVRGPQGWALVSVRAQVQEKRRVSRGKGLVEPGELQWTDLLADEVFGPRIRAALAATPPER